MKKWKWKDATVSHHALLLLRICIVVILAELFLITLQLCCGEYPTQLYAVRLFRGMLEYVMLDITIAVIGAFLFDITAREMGKE